MLPDSESGFVYFLRILNLSLYFIISKYLLEKIAAIILDLEKLSERISVIKLNYRNFLGIVFLPVVMLLFYNSNSPKIIYYIVLGGMLFLNLFTYYQLIKFHQKLIKTYFVYFILYLCTFEIIPYLIIFNWYVNYWN